MPGQRIILIGGSNLSFGINSFLLQQQTGDSVVNMGVHAGLGLTFMLNEATAGVKKGDIVLLCPEYYLAGADKKLLTMLLDINPKAKNYIPATLTDRVTFYLLNIQRCLTSTLKKWNATSDPIYRRDGFTVQGDLITHLNKPSTSFMITKLKAINYTPYFLEMQAFIQKMAASGVQVLYLFPPFAKSAYELNKEVIQQYQNQLHQFIHSPVLGTPTSFVYPDSCFFNSQFHLNNVGREFRTQQLITLLSPFLQHQNL